MTRMAPRTMRVLVLGLGLLVVVVAGAGGYLWSQRPVWSEEETATLRSLWLGSLQPLPPDPSNAVADDPRAVALGQRLFFERGLSGTGQVACATCHLPSLDFQDGMPLARGVGTTTRRTMPIAGTAYSPWLFWDGRKDSQWAQALGPLENPVEHGGSRMQYVHFIAQRYRADYEAIFGPLPDLSDATRFPPIAGPIEDAAARVAWEAMRPEDQEAVTRVFVNIGKAIAAYERRLMVGQAPFDTYVAALLAGDRTMMKQALTSDQVAGLRLFIGQAGCINCHNGPLLTNNSFHNTGVPAVPGLPEDRGRAVGAQQVKDDEFNCLSRYSDAPPEACAELEFLAVDEHLQERAYKPPSLRNVAQHAPYMHAGQFATLRQALAHYNQAPAAPAGHSELQPLNLSEQELAQLEAFLQSLSGPLATPAELLRPPPE